jgi:Ca2+-binding RTX toxin-like protein
LVADVTCPPVKGKVMAIVGGNTNRNILIGTSEADRIFVLNADYVLSGLERDDLLKGGEGDDTLDGDANRDLIDVSGAPGSVSFTLVAGGNSILSSAGWTSLGPFLSLKFLKLRRP